MAITHNTSHVEEGIDRLLEQFKDKPRILAWVTALLGQVQEIEDALYQLYWERLLDNAVGAQLDGIGQIVVLDRQGFDDEPYRAFLRAKIRVNLSNGKTEELIYILKLILGDDAEPIHLVQMHPASQQVYLTDVQYDAYFIYSKFWAKAKAAGVGSLFTYSKQARANTLLLTSSHGGVTTTTSQNPGSSYTSGIGGGMLSGSFG